MNKQISKEIRAEQMMSLRMYFPKFFLCFSITNLHKIVMQHLSKCKYLHVLFCYHEDKFVPVFLFNSNLKIQQFSNEKKAFFYSWSANKLVLVPKNNVEMIQQQSDQFKIYFQETFPEHIITSYVTYELSAIGLNFKNLNNVNMNLSAMIVAKEQYRFSVIFDMPISQCKSLDKEISTFDAKVAHFAAGVLHS